MESVRQSKVAKLLQKEGVKPDLIVSSPAKRALTTAQFFAATFELSGEKFVLEPAIYEAFPKDILKVISGLPDESRTVMLFGHNPTFTEVANMFTDDFIDNLPTCGVIRIESKAESWKELYEENSRLAACFFPKEVL